jgi:TetR/AcrR family transcriptional repressor of nem operon
MKTAARKPMKKQPAPAATARINDPDGLRQRLLDTAFEAFTTRGYAGTSMQDLRELSGTTGGALAHHFATKKALGLAVVNERVAAAIEESWMAPLRAAPDASRGIQQVFGGIIAGLEDQGRVNGCPLNNLAVELSGQEEFRVPMAALFDAWRQAIADKIRDDRKAGCGGTGSPEALATLIVATYSGAMAMARAAQSAQVLRVCAKQLKQVMAA